MPGERMVFFGTEAWGVPSLEALVAAGYQVVAVVTRPDSLTGRGRKLQPSPVKQAALGLGLHVLTPNRVRDVLPQIKAADAKIGTLIAYGKIIPQDVLDAFGRGILNLHPSRLPKHRGPSPIEASIIEEAELGHFSIIRLSADMDAGDIVARGRLDLTEAEAAAATSHELYERVGRSAPAVLVAAVASVFNGDAQYEAQDHAQATFTPMIVKHQAPIDWIQPATAIARKVRAHDGWPGSKTMVDGIHVIITRAHAGDSRPLVGTGETGAQPGTAFKTTHGELAIITGHGELIIDRLKPAGKNEMTGKAFLAGHPFR